MTSPPARHRVYQVHARPEIEAQVDDEWFPGLLRMWKQDEDGSWSAQVSYSRAPGATYIDTVPAERVRPRR